MAFAVIAQGSKNGAMKGNAYEKLKWQTSSVISRN